MLTIFKNSHNKRYNTNQLHIFCIVFLSFFLFAQGLLAQNQPPQISNFSASYNVPNNQVNISYDLFDFENDSIDIFFQISDNLGRSFTATADELSGDLGYPVSSGTAKQIIWRPSTIINFPFYRLRLIASDRKSVDIQTLVDQVDASHLEENLSFLAGVRHRNSGNLIEQVKDSLEDRFTRTGMQIRRQEFGFGAYQAHNIEGRLLGIEAQDTTFILDGHFDGVLGSPAADDNGSAIAGLLEAARILGQYRYQKTIKFVGFDLEEEGLLGSEYYVENGGIEEFETIEGVINLEMIGYSDTAKNSQSVPQGFNQLFPDAYNKIQENDFRGNFLNNVANTRSSRLMQHFDSIAGQYIPDLSVISLAAPGNSEFVPDLRRSDHAVFWDAGYPALMLTDGADFRNPNYHTPNDTLGSLDFTFMKQVTQAAVATLAALTKPVHATDAFTEIELFTNIDLQKETCNYDLISHERGRLLRLSQGACWTSKTEVRLIDIHGRTVWKQKTSDKEILIKNRSYGRGIYYLFILGENIQTIEKIQFGKF